MHKEKFKNFILVMMAFLCMYLSTQVWFEIPYFSEVIESTEDEYNSNTEKIPIWEIVKPEKYTIDSDNQYTVFYSDDENEIWKKTRNILMNSLRDNKIKIEDVLTGDAKPNDYIEISFSSEIPIDIFLKEGLINNELFEKKIMYIKSILFSTINKEYIYIYNGENTFKLQSNNIELSELFSYLNGLNFADYIEYQYNKTIGGYAVMVPVPHMAEAMNPIFVKSEIDISDYEYINKIARDYYKQDYDYVRKLEESSGNIIYVYNNEKVLKINQDGLLDFYDAVEETANDSDVHTSLVKALEFTNNFLGFPESLYLTDVENIQKEGNFGYKFSFSYNVMDKPIIFSQFRQKKALEIEVFGNKVISYERFIRDIDEKQNDKMKVEKVLPAVEVIENNLDFIVQEIYIVENNLEKTDLELIKKELIESIEDIHLAYFDLSRKLKEQQLRIVWVVKTNDRNYIFNAITGSFIEEQIIN